jgi:hypothetical protein
MRRREFVEGAICGSLFGSMIFTSVHAAAAAKPCIPYSNPKAMEYAKKHCAQRENACNTYLKGKNLSDCAHFVAHCLKAGGIEIKRRTGDQLCPWDLAVRNTDIDAHLAELANKYRNVRAIALEDGVVGDIGFLVGANRRGLFSVTHAFMIKENRYQVDNRVIPYFEPPLVWAHSAERCPEGERMDTEYKQYLAKSYRLEDCKSL